MDARVRLSPSKWEYYSESMMIYLLGMGASSHPLRPEACWHGKGRPSNTTDFGILAHLRRSLFTNTPRLGSISGHKRDKYADYFQNSANATEVHRCFCVELGKTFPDYSDDLWGITASDSQNGYVVWRADPPRA